MRQDCKRTEFELPRKATAFRTARTDLLELRLHQSTWELHLRP